MGLKISVNDWRMDEDIANAPTRGYSPQIELPKSLRKAYPELNDFEIGFTDKDPLPQWYGIGWRHLDGHMFPDIESFSRAVGTRFGVVLDAEGHVRQGTNYIMIMPRQYRERVNLKVSKESEDYYDQAVGDAKNKLETLPSETTMEEINATPDGITKAKRGRPKES